MSNPTFIAVESAARRLGIPVRWLRREIQTGGLPSIRAGRRVLVDPDAIRRALEDRAAAEAPSGEGVRDAE